MNRNVSSPYDKYGVTNLNDTYQVVGTQTALAGLTITNAGTFDAVSSGNLFIKGDFTGIALSIGDAIDFCGLLQ